MHNFSYPFKLEVPYSISEINTILTKNVFNTSLRGSSFLTYLYINDEPFIGTYNDHGFKLTVNPKKPSGYSSNLDCPGIIKGRYERHNNLTIIKADISLPVSNKIFLCIFSSILILISFFCLLANLLIGIGLIMVTVLGYAAVSKHFQYACKKAECLFKNMFNQDSPLKTKK